MVYIKSPLYFDRFSIEYIIKYYHAVTLKSSVLVLWPKTRENEKKSSKVKYLSLERVQTVDFQNETKR